MKNKISKGSKESKNKINEFILISSDGIDPYSWASKDIEAFQGQKKESDLKLARSQFCEDEVMDMKKEYYAKTKEELVSTLIEEIIERQTFIKSDVELAKQFELISMVSNPIEDCPSNSSEESKTSRVTKEEKHKKNHWMQ